MTTPPYRIVTERLVLRCWDPHDAPQLKEAVDSSLDELRPWMPWRRLRYPEPRDVLVYTLFAEVLASSPVATTELEAFDASGAPVRLGKAAP